MCYHSKFDTFTSILLVGAHNDRKGWGSLVKWDLKKCYVNNDSMHVKKDIHGSTLGPMLPAFSTQQKASAFC